MRTLYGVVWLLLMTAAMLLPSGRASGQGMRIARQVIGAGGAIGATDGSRSVSFTVGQPLIGLTSGPGNDLRQGFWLPLAATSAVETGAAALVSLAGYPNPSTGRIAIGYAVPSASDVTVTIFDMLGREVRVLAEGREESGNRSVDWNGDDASGTPVSAGEYLCRVDLRPTGGEPIARTILLRIIR